MAGTPPQRPDGLHDQLPDVPRWPGLAVATGQCVRFYSRLPVPHWAGGPDPHAIPDFRIVPRVLPLAALVIALPAATALLVLGSIGLDPALAAAVSITILVVTCGAFHEDGLADAADGLFGGHTVERRLEIMKDSRVGTFGAAAIGLSLVLRITALAAICETGSPWQAAIVVLAGAGWSRSLGIKVLSDDPPARSYGAAAAVGRPGVTTMRWALGVAVLITWAGFATAGLGPIAGLAALTLSGGLAMVVAGLARRLIGGQTGDIAGAAQQLAEIGFYLGVAVVLALSSETV